MQYHSAPLAYDALCRGYFLESPFDGDPVPKVSECHLEGVIAAIYSNTLAAQVSAAELAQDYNQEIIVKPITGLWDVLTNFARQGVSGVMLDEAHPVYFCNRLHDMNRSLPSLAKLEVRELGSKSLSATVVDSLYFGVRGILDVNEAEILPWRNYRAMDEMSVRWMLKESPLPESIVPFTFFWNSNELCLFANGATLLGPYVSDSGAVPVFSYKGVAEYFGLTNRLLTYEGENAVPLGNFSCLQIEGDFEKFLDRVYQEYGPFADIGLNPTCHRFRQGYFFKSPQDSDDWYLRTLSGVFRLSEGGFVPSHDIQPTQRNDDVYGRHADVEIVSGLTTVARYPHKRILKTNMSRVPVHEAREIVLEEFGADLERGVYTFPDLTQVSSDTFVIDGFDKIGGSALATIFVPEEQWYGPLFFPDFVAATRWLISNWIDLDEEVRTKGAKTYHGPYHPGSHDREREKAVSCALMEALTTLAVDTLANGYRPEHSLHLQRLFQDASSTLELTKVGYIGDLLYYDEGVLESKGEFEGDMFTLFQRKMDSIRGRLENQLHLDESAIRNLRRLLGQSFDGLHERSKQILAAAINEFERIGQKPGYDYAGVNMKLCKVVERELSNRVFEAWRSTEQNSIEALADSAAMIGMESDRNGIAAIEYLGKRRNLELGSMRYLFFEARQGNQHPAILSFANFLTSRFDSPWLVSEEFTDALDQISSRYRNGGVHKNLVNYQLCSEAMVYILTGEAAFLKVLLRSTIPRSNPHSP